MGKPPSIKASEKTEEEIKNDLKENPEKKSKV